MSESLSIFNFEYTHKPYDSATGLYYYGARFYDPSIERFITEDSTKGSQASSITLNRYAYANDNPLAIIDSSGNSGWWSSITNAVSNVANTISSNLSSGATEVSNAWNCLPPIDQQAIIIGATVALTVVTAGTAAPVAADVIGTEVAVDVGTEVGTDVAQQVLQTRVT